MSVPEPSKITTPWAAAGLKNTIPPAANPVTGKAGYDLGFPAINMTAKEAGGIPPFGQDFNGVLFSITEVLRYMQAGGRPTFSTAMATAIGGYPKGAVVISNDGNTIYRNTVDSNSTDPNMAGAGWVNEQASPGISKFTSSGSFVVPAGVTTVYLSACAGGGGGGSGGGGDSTHWGAGGGGGGAGKSIIRTPYAVTAGSTITLTVGAGGGGGVATNSFGQPGTTGGNTVIAGMTGGTVTLTGGGGGLGAPNSATGPASGVSGGGGYPNGGYGSDGSNTSGGGNGGTGGSGPYGGGGSGGRAGVSGGLAGLIPGGFGSGGGGGGGAYANVSVANGGAGAVGAPGLVIIDW